MLLTPQFTRQNGLPWNCLPRMKKLLGGSPKIGLLFICLLLAAFFSSHLLVSCQFRKILSLFNVQEHSFHQFQGLRCPLAQPPSYQQETFNFCNQYVNCTLKKIYCVIFLCIQQMNGCEPQSWNAAVLLWGHNSNGVVRLVYMAGL